MLLWHQPHLDPHPPGVQGSWAGLQPNLCLWDTQGQGQGAQRLKNYCLLCVHHCGFCNGPHTHDTTASRQADCPLCSHRNCLPAHSNNTAGNNLCPKGNILNRCYPKSCTSQLYYEWWLQHAMCILWLQYRQVCSAALLVALVHSHWYPWLNEMLLPFTDTLYWYALLQMYSLYKDPSGEVNLNFSNITTNLTGSNKTNKKVA